MKKTTFLLSIFICLYSFSYSQEFGYNTTDIGAEYNWSPNASTYSLQLAFNAKTHHSLIVLGGYNKVQSDPSTADNNESGTGWSASLGYRYYIKILPRRFYIGARIEVSNLEINWSKLIGGGTSKIMVLQPSVETGYTLLINELFFITPYVAAGYQTTLKTNGAAVSYGNGFVPLAGISAGFRF